MWTPHALASERRRQAGTVWRMVEGQAGIGSMKVVDTLAEQEVLEAELERAKPAMPLACADLPWLLATPLRYAPYPRGSRFRRTGQREGCLYAAERVEAAVAEAACYLLLLALDSPGAKRPQNAQERSASGFPYATESGLDLCAPPLAADAAAWRDPAALKRCARYRGRP
jgi:hypothetical protein